MNLSDRTSILTLQVVSSRLGPPVIDLRIAPRGLEMTLTSTLLLDPAEPLPVLEGGVLLGVGVDPGDPTSLSVLPEAADRGFAAVVLKRRGADLRSVDRAAADAGIALLVAADEISWRALDGLLSSVLAPETVDGSQATGAGGELFAIAHAVAAVIGGSVAIEDLGRHVIAYSSIPGQRIDELRRQGILDRQVPFGPADQADYRRVLAASGVVRFPQKGDELPRVAAAIKAGTMPLGTLWAIEGDGQFDDPAEHRLLEGARLAALHLLSAQSAVDLERSQRGDILRRLLEGQPAPETSWSRLGLSAPDTSTLLAAAPSADSVLVSDVTRHLDFAVSAFRPGAALTALARTVYVLVPGDAGLLPDRIADALDAAGLHSVRVAVSAPHAGPTGVPGQRDEVDRILSVVTAPRIATTADVRAELLVAALGRTIAATPALAHPGVVALLDHPSDLAASVGAWLDAHGDVAQAAARLHVHPNTLRYRIRRGAEVGGIDFDDPDTRLVVQLQLRLGRP